METLKKALLDQHNGKKVDGKQLNELVKRLRQNERNYLTNVKNKLDGIRHARRNRIFKDYFGYAMPTDRFMFALTGRKFIDIIRLDQKLCTPGGTSTKNYIAKKYGQAASNFIQSII